MDSFPEKNSPLITNFHYHYMFIIDIWYKKKKSPDFLYKRLKNSESNYSGR